MCVCVCVRERERERDIKIVMRSLYSVAYFGNDSLTTWKFYKKELISVYKEM